jgi:hypothetical protein
VGGVGGRRLLLVPLLVFVVLIAACQQGESAGGAAEGAGADAAAAGLRWHPLGTWTGTGDRQTESFDVRTGTLKLVWETFDERAPGAGRLRIELHSAISGRPLQTVVDTLGVGLDSVYVADEPRVSYLVIASEGVGWRVRLEEGVR